MQCFGNSWRVRNILVMVLRLNKSLKYHDLIPTLDWSGPAPTMSLSTVSTPLLTGRRKCQRRPLSVAPNIHAESSSPQTAGELNISNFTILNTIRTFRVFAARPNTLNPLSIVKSMLTKIFSKTWTRFPTSNRFKTSQIWSLNHRHLGRGLC
jgi:hypothetical protein